MEETDEITFQSMFRKEAKVAWDFEKSLGIGCDGDEEEVISKIAELEEFDEARYRARQGGEEGWVEVLGFCFFFGCLC